MKNNKPKSNTKFFKFDFLDFILSRKANGFTLIELMVALGVFMVVMTITMSAFLNIIDIQKKTEAFRKVNDNLNFAMEAMMRDIREGKNYSIDCGGADFCFTDKEEGTVKYELDENELDKIGYIKRTKGTDELRMTSNGVEITGLSFSVRGNEPGDKQQPLVIISISGKSGIKEKLKSSLNLQATVSQRKLDSL